MGSAIGHRSTGVLVATAMVAVLLACACGLASSGVGAAMQGRGDDARSDDEGSGDCGPCSAGDDASLSLPPPRDAAREARAEASPVQTQPDATMPTDAAPDDCSSTCMTQTCGGPCAQGSVCQLYLSCLVLCGFSDAADCTGGCNSQYPTGPLVAACSIACGAQCASQDDAATD